MRGGGQAAPDARPRFRAPRGSAASLGLGEETDYFGWSHTGRMASGRGAGPVPLGIGEAGATTPDDPRERKEENPRETASAHGHGEDAGGSQPHGVLWECFIRLVRLGVHPSSHLLPPFSTPRARRTPRNLKRRGSFLRNVREKATMS